jgi:hypothetical protein
VPRVDKTTSKKSNAETPVTSNAKTPRQDTVNSTSNVQAPGGMRQNEPTNHRALGNDSKRDPTAKPAPKAITSVSPTRPSHQPKELLQTALCFRPASDDTQPSSLIQKDSEMVPDPPDDLNRDT